MTAPEPARPALAWERARTEARAAVAALPGGLRRLQDCAGAVLAEPLRARSPLPPFDVAAMDGFAVTGPGPWQVVGQVLAGARWPEPLARGTAVGIGTGAPVPEGATAVLAVERSRVEGGVLHGEHDPGRHVRPAGEECAVGDLLLAAGTPLTAAALGLAAAAGHDALPVRPRPRVVAFVTGDELLTTGLSRGAQVRDALGPGLPALVSAFGGRLLRTEHLADGRALLLAALRDAQADVLVTTGASSAGPADHLRPVLDALGGEVLVDGVACRPGHPQLLARLPDGRVVVGLPGNPLAALVGAVTLLQPVLAGLADRPLRPAAGLLAAPLPGWSGGTRLVPVRREGLQVEPLQHTGAGMLRGAAAADGLAVVPPGEGLAAGAQVELLLLP